MIAHGCGAGSCNFCVAEGSMITTETGLFSIEELELGDKVVTLEGPKEVTQIFDMGVGDVVEITTESCHRVKVTPDHEIAVGARRRILEKSIRRKVIVEYEQAQDLSKESALILPLSSLEEDGEMTWRFSRVESVKPAGKSRVYDLTVPGADHFIANGILVHNCMEGRIWETL